MGFSKHIGTHSSTEGHSLKKRESYLVSRISKKDFRALKRIGYTRYEQRDTRIVTG
jgi:hypothetical protein